MPDFVLIDGNKSLDFHLLFQAIIKYDSLVQEISVVLLLAKVT
ncbi:MAG: hypothetical protein ACTS8R_05290 [Arsenophonus sp. NC-QC1-MAG3]